LRFAFRFGVLLIVVTLCAFQSAEAEGLESARARGQLICGVRTDQPAFALREKQSAYTGFETDLCRAMAVALFGELGRVVFKPLDYVHEFFDDAEIDLVIHGLTHTLERERKFAIRFSSVYFYDGQAFMVPVSSGVRSVNQLRGKNICLREGGEAEHNLKKYAANGFRMIFAKDDGQAQANFLAGRCDAYTADESLMISMIYQRAVDSEKYQVLPERISKEPLAGITRRDDDEMGYLLNAVIAALIEAEERGITTSAVASSGERDEKVKRFSQWAGILAPTLPADWALRVIRAFGNYGEMYERHFAKARSYGIERGLNRTWNAGGILYALPMR